MLYSGHPTKDARTGFRAFAMVREKHPEARLLMFGKTPPRLRGRAERGSQPGNRPMCDAVERERQRRASGAAGAKGSSWSARDAAQDCASNSLGLRASHGRAPQISEIPKRLDSEGCGDWR
jgi:hypothetical protein